MKEIKGNIMSFKHIFTVFLLAVVAVVMTACGFNPVKDNPSEYASIYGNGGMQIRKGDYIYFVNGFYGIDEVESSDTKFGKAERGAIYRTKLVDGALQINEDGELTDVDVIVPKIVGYEVSSFYIFGDHIFYASPNNEKDKYGELTKNKVDFFRCEIDGSNNSRIYTTTSEHSQVQFNVVSYANGQNRFKTFLLVLDGDKLLTFRFENGKNKGKTVIAESGVSSVAWLKQQNFVNNGQKNTGVTSAESQKVYFTQSGEDILTNKIASYDLLTEETKDIVNDGLSTFTLKDYQNGKIYYEKAKGGSTQFVVATLAGAFNESVIFYNSYSDYFVLSDDEGQFAGGVLATNDNGTYYVPNGGNGAENKVTIADKKYNILFANGSQVYVRESDAQIKMFDLTDETFETKNILVEGVVGKFDGKKYVDFDGRFITYLAESKSGDSTFYYTHLVDLTSFDGENYQDIFVGEYAEDEDPNKVSE